MSECEPNIPSFPQPLNSSCALFSVYGSICNS